MHSSRFWFPGPPLLSLVSSHLGRFLAVLSRLFPPCSRKLSVLSVFLFLITRGLRYRFFILFYFEALSRPFLLFGNPPKIRRVFPNTPNQ